MGRPQVLSEQGIALEEEVTARARNLAVVGRTVIMAASTGQVVGMLVLEDTLRPEASQVITRLKKLGIRTVLVTGDNSVTAERAECGLCGGRRERWTCPCHSERGRGDGPGRH
jgi:P-type E1-E2 ATPase